MRERARIRVIQECGFGLAYSIYILQPNTLEDKIYYVQRNHICAIRCDVMYVRWHRERGECTLDNTA